MIKKVLVLTTLCLFGLTLVGCNQEDAVTKPQTKVEQMNKDSAQQNANAFYQPSIIVGNETAPEIARSLLQKYLQHYSSNEVPESERLKDYKIKEITIKEKINDGFVYSAKFSVQGFNDTTHWVAGNGIVKDHGWIEDKFMFITVIQKDNTFTMTGWGTSP
jgi:hypothetical protein